MPQGNFAPLVELRRQDGDRHGRLVGHRRGDHTAAPRGGCRVAGGARRIERIDADVALQLDVTDEASSRAFVDAAVEALGGIDILFNNAGLALRRVPFEESTEEVEATVLHTNVDGVLRITRLCLPHIRDEGHILFMGSIAGRQAYPHGASYIASKFAVRGSRTRCGRTCSAGRSG